jgi:plastocyanin
MKKPLLTAGCMLLVLLPGVARAGGLKGKVVAEKEFADYFAGEETDVGKEKVDFYWQVENGVLPIVPPKLEMSSQLGVAVFRKDGKVEPGFLPVHPEIEGAMLLPGVVVAPPKTTFKFHNADPFVHELFCEDMGKLFEPELQSSKQTRQVQFNNEGVYKIGCKMTPHLHGYIVIVPGVVAFKNPAEDGTFLFEDMAPGEYVIKVYYRGQVVATAEATVVDSDREKDYANVELKLAPPKPGEAPPAKEEEPAGKDAGKGEAGKAGKDGR